MMKNQLAGLMKQAQQMQDNMKKVQDSLADIEVEGQSGAGLVKVVMTCRNDVRRIAIDPSLLADDKDMLEDLVAAAVNDALRRAEQTAQEKMSAVTAGLPLPPGFKMPFCWLTAREGPRRPRRTEPGPAWTARRGPTLGQAAGLSPAAARPRCCTAPVRGAGACP